MDGNSGEAPPQQPLGPEATLDPYRLSVLDPDNPTLTALPGATLPTIQPMDDLPAEIPVSGGSPAQYHLQRLIARGGCGVVWEALQVSLKRTIAVKMIREDRFESQATNDEQRRAEMLSIFRQEALAAAALEHPNILPVHELGFDEHGKPLLAMKLVRGTPWHESIHQDRNLPVAEFLSKHLPILIDVCQAVDFAHSRGIVHRDLKPAQVMLGEFGEVLLMDWGLALHLPDRDSREAPRKSDLPFLPTPVTASSPAGTPAYMAPEQTLKSASEIGEWTDIYLLGGMLYQLLTLTVPHPGDITQQVLEKAASGVVESPSNRAPYRIVPVELEEIALRALHPDPAKRYSSARDLINALNDYLSGASRRARSEELVGLVAASLNEPSLSYRDFGKCNVQLEEAKSLWPDNPEIAALRDRLQIVYAHAGLKNSDLVLARLQAERIEDEGEREVLVTRINELEARHNRREKQRRIGIAASFISLTLLLIVAGSFAWFQNEARRRENRITAQLEQSNTDLQQRNEELNREQQRVAKARADAENLVSFILNDLSDKLVPLGKLDILNDAGVEALEYYRNLPQEDLEGEAAENHVLALLSIGEVMLKQGNLPKAEETLLEARRRAKTLMELTPSDVNRRRRYAGTLDRLGDLYTFEERFEEALEVSQESLEVLEVLYEEDPEEIEHQRNVGVGYFKVGRTLSRMERFEEALKVYEKCEELRLRIAEKAPDNALVFNDLAALYDLIGKSREGIGEIEGALEAHFAGLEFLERAIEVEPDNINWGGNLAISRANVGDMLLELERSEEALKEYENALVVAKQIVEHDPTNTVWQNVLAWNYKRLSWALESLQRLDEAIDVMRECVAIYTALKESSETAHWDITLANNYEHLGLVCMEAGRFAEALDSHESGRAIRNPLIESGEATYKAYFDEYLNNYYRAAALVGLEKPEEAKTLISESLDLIRTRRGEEAVLNQAAAEYHQEHCIHGAGIFQDLGDKDRAFQLLAEAVETQPLSDFLKEDEIVQKLRQSDPERFTAIAGE